MADDAQPPTHESLQKRWHGQDADLAQSGTRQRRRVVLYVLIGLFLALFSIAIALLLFIQPPAPTPFFLTLNIADYNARQFPVRPFAQQDVTLLMRHFPAKLRDQPVTQSRDLFRKQLNQLKDRPPTPLIVHVAALALVRDDKVYLLPGDADPDDYDSWIPLGELIDAVESCPGKNKLLILDIAHSLVDPRLGVLTDRVAQVVEENLRKTPPSFYVLSSAAAGQWGLSSEAMQCSAFAYYLDQGLQGNAAITKPGFVTVTDLAEFVKLRVDRWARMNRQARQTPVLLGKGVDFTILQLNDKTLEPAEKPKLTAYPDALQKAWEKRDELRGVGAVRTAPRLLSMLDARLLRRQSRWQGGAGAVPSLTKECDDLVSEMQRVMTSDAATPRSLAATVRPTKEMEGLADSLVRTLNNQVGAKKIEEELVKKLGADKKAEPAQQAWAVFDALYRIVLPTQDQVLAANSVLSGKLPYVEVIYLRRLADFARGEYPETWPPDKARAALLTMRAQQTLLAALRQEPEMVPWMRTAVEEADRCAGRERKS